MDTIAELPKNLIMGSKPETIYKHIEPYAAPSSRVHRMWFDFEEAVSEVEKIQASIAKLSAKKIALEDAAQIVDIDSSIETHALATIQLRSLAEFVKVARQKLAHWEKLRGKLIAEFRELSRDYAGANMALNKRLPFDPKLSYDEVPDKYQKEWVKHKEALKRGEMNLRNFKANWLN